MERGIPELRQIPDLLLRQAPEALALLLVGEEEVPVRRRVPRVFRVGEYPLATVVLAVVGRVKFATLPDVQIPTVTSGRANL